MTFSPNNSQSLTTWTKDYIAIFNVSKKLAWRRAKQIRQMAKQFSREGLEVGWIS